VLNTLLSERKKYIKIKTLLTRELKIDKHVNIAENVLKQLQEI
jgi:hypothetical protein